MKAKETAHKLSPEEDRQLARIAAVLRGSHGKELQQTLRRWIMVFFKYQQLKDRGFDVDLISARPGVQLVRINTKRKAQ